MIMRDAIGEGSENFNPLEFLEVHGLWAFSKQEIEVHGLWAFLPPSKAFILKSQ